MDFKLFATLNNDELGLASHGKTVLHRARAVEGWVVMAHTESLSSMPGERRVAVSLTFVPDSRGEWDSQG
jgi:hypothetical protein